ncbi:MAG: MotA/TolQ/ExbB proton channel family protein [Rickettsiales bacterium]|nr:MotA/TolQ/ExbB proton channel family protein [Rickettsiales bacterium]
MSLTALFGVIAGVGLFLFAVLMSTENAALFLSMSSFAMVLGGTVATSFMSFQHRYVFIGFKAIWWMLKKPKSTREGLNEEIMRLIKWAYLVQQKGLPSLENEIKSVNADPVVRYCMECVAAGHRPEDLRAMMETAVESEYERNTVPVNILQIMGATSPAFGMIGTLVGLVAVLQGMGNAGDDMMAVVGNGMALALITTLYGVVFARLMFLPAATQLKQKEEIERFRNYLVIEGLIMLSEKKGPRYMQDRLNSFLDPAIHFNIDKQIRG